MTVSTLRRLFLTSFAVLASLGVALSAALAADIEGSSDHPLVGRYEGSEIVAYKVVEFDEVTVIEAPYDYVQMPKGPGFKTLEGKSFLIYYTLPQGRSTLEVLRNWEDALKAKGFSIDFTCATDKGTCFTSGQDEGGYYLGQSVGGANDIPKMVDDYVHNWFGKGRYVLGKLDQPEGAVYVAIYLGESERGNVAVVRVVETKEMETDKIQFVNAAQMEQALDDTGKIALYGILFDFDKDVIKPESKPTLDEIASLLSGKPDLNVQIVGHTDNQGTADYNLNLSKRRAASVVTALSGQYGIAADRLSSEGMGATEPVDTNDTEEGRAKNRRVELVTEGAAAGGAPASAESAPETAPEAAPSSEAAPEAEDGDENAGGGGGEAAPNP